MLGQCSSPKAVEQRGLRLYRVYRVEQQELVVVEFYPICKTNNKPCQIKWRFNTNTDTNIATVACVSLPNVMIYLHRDLTGIREYLDAMQYSIELDLSFIGTDKRDIYEQH